MDETKKGVGYRLKEIEGDRTKNLPGNIDFFQCVHTYSNRSLFYYFLSYSISKIRRYVSINFCPKYIQLKDTGKMFCHYFFTQFSSSVSVVWKQDACVCECVRVLFARSSCLHHLNCMLCTYTNPANTVAVVVARHIYCGRDCVARCSLFHLYTAHDTCTQNTKPESASN